MCQLFCGVKMPDMVRPSFKRFTFPGVRPKYASLTLPMVAWPKGLVNSHKFINVSSFSLVFDGIVLNKTACLSDQFVEGKLIVVVFQKIFDSQIAWPSLIRRHVTIRGNRFGGPKQSEVAPIPLIFNANQPTKMGSSSSDVEMH